MPDSSDVLNPRTVVVYTGPSLHPREAATLLDAAFLPPVQRGGLPRLLQSCRPHMVGIIDGEFYQSLAVTPAEVLALLEAGVAVYGAASMGALRAVELERYGMVGVGSVFRLFRKGVLDADDEVALAYNGETYEAVSEPLVNTRYALRAAVRRGILSRRDGRVILQQVRSTYFPERTRELLLQIAGAVIGRVRTAGLRGFLASSAPDVKAQDARRMLARMKKDWERAGG